MGSNSSSGLWWVVGFGTLALLWWFGTKFVRDVAGAIEEWKIPHSPGSEAVLRTALADHLRQSLPGNVSVIEEYGAEKSRTDIAVLSSNRQADQYTQIVAIELKHKLRVKTELDRLVGQIMGYRSEGFDKAMIVSVDPEPNLHEVLKNRSETEGLSGFMMISSKSSAMEA